MSVDAASSLSLSRQIAADRQAVWDAWTEPEQMKRWACPEGGTVVDVEAELRVGGAYAIRMDVEGQRHTAVGVYREIDPPRRIVYTWDWQEEGARMGETVVTVEFHEVPGGTEVRLTHEGFSAPEARDGHEQGWQSCLNRFEALFA